MKQSFFVLLFASFVFVSANDEVQEHMRILKSRNGVRLLMYHGGYSSQLSKKDDFRKYLQTYVDFVKEKHIDKVMISIMDPTTVTFLNEDVILEFMQSLPSYVELGALLEIDPRYPWHYDVNVPGGYNPFHGVVYGGGGGDNPTTPAHGGGGGQTTTPAHSGGRGQTTTAPSGGGREAIIKRILSPGPGQCKPRNINEAELFCTGNYNIDPRWKATCGGDPCGFVSKGSYCQGLGVCHGFPPLPPVAAYGNFMAASGNTCPPATNADPTSPPGCPNNIPKAVAFLSHLNKMAQVQDNPNGARMFTFAGFDSEDGGPYRPSALVNFYVSMISSNDFLNSIPDGYSIPSAGLGPASGRDQKAKMVFFGDAGAYSKNPKGELSAIDCSKFIPAGDKSSLTQCNTVLQSILPHIETYPELYWWVDDIQESGCISCTPGQSQMFTETSNYWNLQQITSINQCSQCYAQGSCKKYVRYYTNANAYHECIKDPECHSCCQCLGCLSCAFDSSGRAFGPQNPNSRLIYQKYRNNPSGLLNFLYPRIKSGWSNLWKIPNTWPMFSIETSHNWDVTEGGYKYDAGYGPNTCLARSFGGSTCGIFDGFGDWQWDKYLDLLLQFATKYGLRNVGIYEIQFLPAHWFNSGHLSHPGSNSRPLDTGGAPRLCPSANIIAKVNENNGGQVTDPKFVIDSYAKAASLYHGTKGNYEVCAGLTFGDPCQHVNPASWFDTYSGICHVV